MKFYRNSPLSILIPLLLLATFVRVWGIDFGLPYEGITYNQVTFEESQEVLRAFKLGAGEYAWVFGKGGLYYLLFVEYGFYYVVSLALGWVDNPRDFALQVVENRTPIYVMGRLTVALMGVLTCLVIYQVGRRSYDWRLGIGAAAIGATAYFHSVFSSVINVDIGMTLALWTSLLCYVLYERSDNLRLLVASGVLGAVAIAFKLPGGVIVPLVFAAMLSSPLGMGMLRRKIKAFAIFAVSLIATLTLIAPEWITGIADIQNNFSGLLRGDAREATDAVDLADTVKVISAWGGSRWRYVQHLLQDYNLILTVAALAGAAIGIYQRNRWDIFFGAFWIGFIVVMSLADRAQPERYLLPVMPAMWLLATRAVFYVAGDRAAVKVAGLICIVFMSCVNLLQSGIERLRPDTRVSAKIWIEENVPAGSKILMDGMRYRFIPSPPLNPASKTLTSQVSRASEEGSELSRGVSDMTLSVYQEAMERLDGPTYELRSTMHGLRIKPAEHYVENCFNYVITSSLITRRFATGSRSREVSPLSAKFYDELPTDSRFKLVYSISPRSWYQAGPEISVYEVASTCAAP
jgi:4-amino-4-deoxy-L-arabinose transferase-like glycosyltransferase